MNTQRLRSSHFLACWFAAGLAACGGGGGGGGGDAADPAPPTSATFSVSCLQGDWTADVEDVQAFDGSPSPFGLDGVSLQFESPVVEGAGATRFAVDSPQLEIPSGAASFVGTEAADGATVVLKGVYYSANDNVSVVLSLAGFATSCEALSVTGLATVYAGDRLTETVDPQTGERTLAIAPGSILLDLQTVKASLGR